MSYSNLIYQGKSSSDLGLMVEYPFNVVHATPDLDPQHIKGRSGDFLQADESYQNVSETFNCRAYRPPSMSQFDWERNLIDWLASPINKGRKQYQYLQFDADPKYVYSAIMQTPPSFTWDANNIFLATGQITFYCEPFQYRASGITYIPLPDSGVVHNEEMRLAIPNWHFIAKGSFTLNVNGLTYEFSNMDGEFWVNGDTCDTYDEKGNLFNSQTKFPNLITPVLKPGENHISITAENGVIQKAEYMPRWRRLI